MWRTYAPLPSAAVGEERALLSDVRKRLSDGAAISAASFLSGITGPAFVRHHQAMRHDIYGPLVVARLVEEEAGPALERLAPEGLARVVRENDHERPR